MNKLFIGLLIVAAGAGVYFLLNKKKNEATVSAINKELIVGKWKALSEQPPGKDTSHPTYQYEFQKEGTVLRSLNDSAIADTSHYEWSKTNDLVWKETNTDSIGKIYSIVLLTKDSLQIQSKDSVTTLLIKTK